ncbi:MAG: alpha/beta fold hydrolase [Bacteroidota bacterium]
MAGLLQFLPPLLRAGSAVAPGPMAALAWRMFRSPRDLDKPASAREERLRAAAQTERIPAGADADAVEIQLYRWPAATEVSAPARTALLVHGWEGDALNFVAFVEPLRQAGFDVVALDGPAHGASSGERSDALRHARAIMAAIQHLGHVDLLVGHSFGGYACAFAVAGVPDLIEPQRVGRLALIAAPDTFEGVFHRFAQMVGFSQAVERRIHSRVEAMGGQPASFFSVRHALGTVAVPTLVIHDRADKEIPFAEGEANGAAGPHVAFHPTDGLGHRRILRAPDVVQTVVSFGTKTTPVRS